tara:strand:+ start:906 stop:1028 length:123 start_codon:yes stop_codon:yes gene_type:complete
MYALLDEIFMIIFSLNNLARGHLKGYNLIPQKGKKIFYKA